MTFCKLQSLINFRLFFDPNKFFLKVFFQGLNTVISGRLPAGNALIFQ